MTDEATTAASGPEAPGVAAPGAADPARVEHVVHTLTRADGSEAARIVRNRDGERVLCSARVLVGDILVDPPAGGAVRRALSKVFMRGGNLEPRGETRNTEAVVLARIERAVAARPGWCVRVYRLVDGLRLMAVHDVLDPAGSEARDFLVDAGIDREIVDTQLAIGAYRVRVSPLLERTRVGPPPVTLPFASEADAKAYADWELRFEVAGARFAACHMLKRFGDERSVPETATMIELHDKSARSASSLPLA